MRVAIIGATGRMGAAILRVLPDFPQARLTAAIASPGSRQLGQDVASAAGLPACGVTVSSQLADALRTADVALDFSTAAALQSNLSAAVAAGVPVLIGTTGHGSDGEASIQAAAARIPLLVASNTSLGVALLQRLAREAARALGPEFDIEILEAHHRRKVDAPSGTALALGAAVAEGRGKPLGAPPLPAERLGPRPEGAVGYASIRGGDLVGEHEVQFLGPGERLILGHRATDRSIFARGALKAGQWLVGRTPGRYSMADVFS